MFVSSQPSYLTSNKRTKFRTHVLVKRIKKFFYEKKFSYDPKKRKQGNRGDMRKIHVTRQLFEASGRVPNFRSVSYFVWPGGVTQIHTYTLIQVKLGISSTGCSPHADFDNFTSFLRVNILICILECRNMSGESLELVYLWIIILSF